MGADVWTPELVGPLAGVQSAKTDANGYFDISDVEAWKDDGTRPWTKSRPPGRTAPTGTAFRCLRVWRADYGLKIGNYSQVPATVNVSFEKPASVIGRAFDRAAAKPLSGALVELETALTEVNAAKNVYGHDEAVTDEHGNFRLVIQGGGTCRLWFVRRSADVKVIMLSKSPDRQIEVACGQSTRPWQDRNRFRDDNGCNGATRLINEQGNAKQEPAKCCHEVGRTGVALPSASCSCPPPTECWRLPKVADDMVLTPRKRRSCGKSPMHLRR